MHQAPKKGDDGQIFKMNVDNCLVVSAIARPHQINKYVMWTEEVSQKLSSLTPTTNRLRCDKKPICPPQISCWVDNKWEFAVDGDDDNGDDDFVYQLFCRYNHVLSTRLRSCQISHCLVVVRQMRIKILFVSDLTEKILWNFCLWLGRLGSG